MNRRQTLTAGCAALFGSIAGCLGQDPDVPVVATETAYDWFENTDTRFVDARSRAEYEEHRIDGAVLSPADDGLEENDPVDEWATDTRIVTYCVCPHALAKGRASSLIDDGYDDVHALDDGLQDWIDQGHPVAGTEVSTALPEYEIRGLSDAGYAGSEVWVREPRTNQREVTTVNEDGSYTMTIHFAGLTDETRLTLEAPDYELEAPLAELTSDTVVG